MPRRLLERRYWERLEERRARLAQGITQRWRVGGRPDFIDYWPAVPATIPEKMVFAELVRRQVSFYFSWYFGDLRITPDVKERYRPDFYLPDYGIIIEVYGVYWHTRPGQYKHDVIRAFYLTASGYKVYILTDQQVLMSPSEAVDTIPELRSPIIRGNQIIIGDRPFNPTAAIAARLSKWPRKFSARYRGRPKTGIGPSWPGGAKPLRPKPPIGPLFTGLSDELIAEAERLRQGYLEWLSAYSKWKARKKGG